MKWKERGMVSMINKDYFKYLIKQNKKYLILIYVIGIIIPFLLINKFDYAPLNDENITRFAQIIPLAYGFMLSFIVPIYLFSFLQKISTSGSIISTSSPNIYYVDCIKKLHNFKILKNDKKVLTKNNSSNIMLISEEKNKCIWRERKDENINRSIISKLMAIITILETRFRHICIIVYNTNNMDNNKIIKRKYKKQKSIININSDYNIIKYIFYI